MFRCVLLVSCLIVSGSAIAGPADFVNWSLQRVSSTVARYHAYDTDEGEWTIWEVNAGNGTTRFHDGSRWRNFAWSTTEFYVNYGGRDLDGDGIDEAGEMDAALASGSTDNLFDGPLLNHLLPAPPPPPPPATVIAEGLALLAADLVAMLAPWVSIAVGGFAAFFLVRLGLMWLRFGLDPGRIQSNDVSSEQRNDR
ncbi:MAG: hypothetical protein AAFU85_01450 [Planctomycetota bacterium]